MSYRIGKFISFSVYKYQRVFFGVALATFITLLLAESYHKLGIKKRHWKLVKSTFSDSKSTAANFAPQLRSNASDNHQKDIHFVIDPLESKQRHHTSHPQIEWNVYKDRTEEGGIKQWIPSPEQKRTLSSHRAKYHLDFEGEDVLVFMHIPKTSGKTFNTHLVVDMKVPQKIQCQCKTLDKPHGCKCLNSEGYIWLFSRLPTAWPCGVHPSWSDLSRDCLNHAMDRKEGRRRKRR